MDSVFYVDIKENLEDDIYVVGIIKNGIKILLSDDVKIGSTGKAPSKYIEVDGRLFYWWDNNYPLSKEALSIFKTYGLIQGDENGTILFPSFEIDDSLKGVDYFFCKSDHTIYKKVITDKGFGYYKPPNLNCPGNN